MTSAAGANRLDRPVDASRDHVLGGASADLTLVEYGSYACPYCRAANEEVAALRDRFGERLRYVFRQRPITDSELARRAAELAESSADEGAFWRAHVELMSRSHSLTEDDLRAVADDVVFARMPPDARAATLARAAARVDADVDSARRSGVSVTPTFFINGRRYDGAWDRSTLAEAMLGSLGHRVHSAAVDFARWAPSTGLLLLAMSLLAVALVNSASGAAFTAFWHTPVGLAFGDAAFRMSLLHWVHDALLTIFFLVVGLEIKRELVDGHLATWPDRTLPTAAALGGMVVPALLFVAINASTGTTRGWGIPMATDIAFAMGVLALLGRRVPVSLKVFLLALAIVDDLGAILVIAVFYSGSISLEAVAWAAVVLAAIVALKRAGVQSTDVYVVLGVALWMAVYKSGIHATLAGVILAALTPARPQFAREAFEASAVDLLASYRQALAAGDGDRAQQLLGEFEALSRGSESPLDRLERMLHPWVSYLIVPVFAFMNAGVAISSSLVSDSLASPVSLGVATGLALGKPVGILLACFLAVRLGLADLPRGLGYRQMLGAGLVAGIGFTVSLFITNLAFDDARMVDEAKLGILAASTVAGLAGFAWLWFAQGSAPAAATEAQAAEPAG